MVNPFLSIAAVLWCLIALLLMQQWIMGIKKVPVGLKIFIFFLILITAPALIINDIVMNFLDMVLPEGWNDDLRPKA